MTTRGALKRIASFFFTPRADSVRDAYQAFAALLRIDRLCLEEMAVLERACDGGSFTVSFESQRKLLRGLPERVQALARQLEALAPGSHHGLDAAASRLGGLFKHAYSLPLQDCGPPYTLSLHEAAGAPDLAGDKAARLGHAALSGFPAPSGFVVTTNAFRAFMEANSLQPVVDALLEDIDPGELTRLEAACQTIRQRVMEGVAPAPVSEALMLAVTKLLPFTGLPPALAVRSSALMEDRLAGFAGQYRSMLHVLPDDATLAFKRVLAGKYLARAVSIRMRMGLADQEAPMAVLVMPMVGGPYGGVAYSLDPLPGPNGEVARVYAVAGSPEGVVNGTMTPLISTYSRDALSLDAHGAGEIHGASAAQTQAVARMALDLEQLYGAPQDVEWCEDTSGKLWLLQTRDLPRPLENGSPRQPSRELAELYRGGIQASPGTAWGRAFHLEAPSNLSEVPEGSILFVKSLWTELALVLHRVRGVVSETGSQAGHLSSLARSSGVPVLAAAEGSMARVAPGVTLTLDVDARTIFAGKAEGRHRRGPAAPGLATPAALDRWKDALERVAPLNLTDPDSAAFTPQAVQTLHDMVRFCHEMAVRAMFTLGRKGCPREACKTGLNVPLSLRVLDLEGGPDGGEKHHAMDARPLSFGPLLGALCEGLEHPKACWNAVAPHADLDNLALSLEGGIIAPSEAGLSAYAIVSKAHLHFLARFGFHFAVLDCHIGAVSDENHLNFSFKGGGGARSGRLARQGLLSWILEREGYSVSIKGDLLTASLPRPARQTALRNLSLLGFILARTIFLDMAEDGPALDAAAKDILDVSRALCETDTQLTDSAKRTPSPS